MSSPREVPLSPRHETFCNSYVYFPNAAREADYVAAARTFDIQARLASLMPSVNERLRDAGGDKPRE